MDLRKVAAEITARRLAATVTGAITAEVREQMISDCEESLENVMNRQILAEIERLGRAAEFNRLLDDADSDVEAYLARVIPNYAQWAEQAAWRAIKEVEEGRG